MEKKIKNVYMKLKKIMFAECKDNTYGLECAQICGKCVHGNQCNHENGSCSSGCDKGVHGDKCNKGLPHCYLY